METEDGGPLSMKPSRAYEKVVSHGESSGLVGTKIIFGQSWRQLMKRLRGNIPRLYGWRAREVWTWFTNELVMDGTSDNEASMSRVPLKARESANRYQPLSYQASILFHPLWAIFPCHFHQYLVNNLQNVDVIQQPEYSRIGFLTSQSPDMPTRASGFPDVFDIDGGGHCWRLSEME